jgi:hypothetical protein
MVQCLTLWVTGYDFVSWLQLGMLTYTIGTSQGIEIINKNDSSVFHKVFI